MNPNPRLTKKCLIEFTWESWALGPKDTRVNFFPFSAFLSIFLLSFLFSAFFSPSYLLLRAWGDASISISRALRVSAPPPAVRRPSPPLQAHRAGAAPSILHVVAAPHHPWHLAPLPLRHSSWQSTGCGEKSKGHRPQPPTPLPRSPLPLPAGNRARSGPSSPVAQAQRAPAAERRHPPFAVLHLSFPNGGGRGEKKSTVDWSSPAIRTNFPLWHSHGGKEKIGVREGE
jgi:hypothetical protein